MTTNARVALAVLVCLVAAPAATDDGAFPIWGPTTITQPGHYVLVRNIGNTSSSNVLIIAADDVDLDLNGFTITCSNTAVSASGARGLAVHDGFLHCVLQTVRWTNLENFSLRGVVSVTDVGEMAIEILESKHGVVEDNTIRIGGDDALWVTGSAVAIRDNQFDADVQIYAAGCEVSGNLWENGTLLVARSGNAILDNVLHATWGYDGILVFDGASDNRVFRNTVSARMGNGISVRGSHNQVVDNVLNGNGGFGLLFGASSSGNVFRGNSARGNDGSDCPTANTDFCDYGTSNTSHGDNYMPGRL